MDMNKKIIEQFAGFVDFLGVVLGNNTEIVLHDCENPDGSVVAICNGHLSGRSVGSPMTNLLLKILQENNGQASLTKYYATSESGREFYSFTYFIRNEDENIIGAMCINMDVDKYREFFNLLGNQFNFFNHNTQTADQADIKEILSGDVASIINGLMAEALKKNGFTHGNMSVDEKERFVETLLESGAFLYKGSVSQVAKFLRISEPTGYRYISKAKKKGNAV